MEIKKYIPLVIMTIFFGAAFFLLLFLVINKTFNVSIDVIIVLLTASLSGYGWVIKNEYDKKREIERQDIEWKQEQERLTFETRRKTYEDLLAPFVNMFALGPHYIEDMDRNELKQQMTRAGFKLNIYGSDEVIRAYNNFTVQGRTTTPDGIRLIAEFGRLLLAIRTSTGFSKTDLSVEEILRSFIIDYEAHREEILRALQ